MCLRLRWSATLAHCVTVISTMWRSRIVGVDADRRVGAMVFGREEEDAEAEAEADSTDGSCGGDGRALVGGEGIPPDPSPPAGASALRL